MIRFISVFESGPAIGRPSYRRAKALNQVDQFWMHSSFYTATPACQWIYISKGLFIIRISKGLYIMRLRLLDRSGIWAESDVQQLTINWSCALHPQSSKEPRPTRVWSLMGWGEWQNRPESGPERTLPTMCHSVGVSTLCHSVGVTV